MSWRKKVSVIHHACRPIPRGGQYPTITYPQYMVMIIWVQSYRIRILAPLSVQSLDPLSIICPLESVLVLYNVLYITFMMLYPVADTGWDRR